MEKTYIIICLALYEYIFFAMKVGFSRNKFNIKAPSMSGNQEWERLNRIHQNTLEVYMIFIPTILGFSYYVSENYACCFGILVLIARVWFYLTYKKDAKKRMPGVFLTSFANYTMLTWLFFTLLIRLF